MIRAISWSKHYRFKFYPIYQKSKKKKEKRKKKSKYENFYLWRVESFMVLITRAIVLTLLVCQNTVITLPWRKSVIDKIPT